MKGLKSKAGNAAVGMKALSRDKIRKILTIGSNYVQPTTSSAFMARLVAALSMQGVMAEAVDTNDAIAAEGGGR